jgi:hypothetical protein
VHRSTRQRRADMRTWRLRGGDSRCSGSSRSSSSSRCPVARMRGVTSSNCEQEMDIRVEYDKAKAVKWLMAPGLIEISAEDIAAAHAERNAREIARCILSYRTLRRFKHPCDLSTMPPLTPNAEKPKSVPPAARCATQRPPPSKSPARCAAVLLRAALLHFHTLAIQQ